MPEPTSEPLGATGSPEFELLLCCAVLDARRAERTRALLQRGIDWENLLRLALPLGMTPLLYRHLSLHSPEPAPKEIRDRLKEHFYANARRNLFLTGELIQILSLFETAGIPAIPIKGPVLTASLFGNIALRPFFDLDILVPRQAVPKARDLLASRGYRGEYALTPEHEAAFFRTKSVCNFVREDGRAIVDLHWEIMPRYFACPFDTESLFKRSTRRPFMGIPVRHLSPEDLILVLSMHGFKHHWHRLDWLCSLAALIQTHPDLDWRRVMKESERLGGLRMARVGFRLANDLLGAPLPGDIVKRIRDDPTVSTLAAETSERLFGGADEPGKIRLAFFHIRGFDRLRDKIRYCSRVALTPGMGDWASMPLSPFLSFLYYPFRPIRLIKRYVAWRFLLKRVLARSVEKQGGSDLSANHARSETRPPAA